MSERTQELQLGMTKQQVTKILGKEFQTVGAQASSLNGQVEVIRYKDDDDGELLIYFRDGKLVQWGDTAELANIPQ
jgi:outer membrane protein assembly factor BamE (lipoprotein component of BamABCDE complex)